MVIAEIVKRALLAGLGAQEKAKEFIDELVKAGKMFDLMIYPMRKHGISDDPAQIHLYKTMLEFWTKNVLRGKGDSRLSENIY